MLATGCTAEQLCAVLPVIAGLLRLLPARLQSACWCWCDLLTVIMLRGSPLVDAARATSVLIQPCRCLIACAAARPMLCVRRGCWQYMLWSRIKVCTVSMLWQCDVQKEGSLAWQLFYCAV